MGIGITDDPNGARKEEPKAGVDVSALSLRGGGKAPATTRLLLSEPAGLELGKTILDCLHVERFPGLQAAGLSLGDDRLRESQIGVVVEAAHHKRGYGT